MKEMIKIANENINQLTQKIKIKIKKKNYHR